jgi:hypothetical protein
VLRLNRQALTALRLASLLGIRDNRASKAARTSRARANRLVWHSSSVNPNN